MIFPIVTDGLCESLVAGNPSAANASFFRRSNYRLKVTVTPFVARFGKRARVANTRQID